MTNYVRDYTRATAPPEGKKMDIFDHGYAARIWLYIFCGLLDAMWQTTAYWIMGAMSNDPGKLAYFTGFCMSDRCSAEALWIKSDAIGSISCM